MLRGRGSKEERLAAELGETSASSLSCDAQSYIHQLVGFSLPFQIVVEEAMQAAQIVKTLVVRCSCPCCWWNDSPFLHKEALKAFSINHSVWPR
jgi:hypothetical protein